ncbi:uncharacterized protein K02A2.6-like [Notechis scutatus]|uniref:Gypsy retrotransposon integrase-like protein 1 n=1 Tax=Notechis scutatus TaxID=8663 RepID=A0A6J1URH8_9SAUR|nr:uncharacterized protein K02A2.6-like [Notechis scutatus]
MAALDGERTHAPDPGITRRRAVGAKRRLAPTICHHELEDQTLTLKDYQGNRISVVGRGHFKITFKDRTEVLPLTIVDRDRPSLLGLQWFAPLGIEVTGIHHVEEADWEAALGCILWGDRVVIPDKLQERVLGMLHEGHPGMVKMKSVARSYAWWPGIDKQIETWVAKCKQCQESRPNPPAAPIQEWETPRGPWSRIHIDFAGPTKGHMYLITVDAYSNWLEVSTMKSTTTEAVIKKLNKLFATHGLPDVLVSDYGPQFTALAFEQFLAGQGIRHALTAPANPAANGRAERMVQYTKKTIQKIEATNIQDRINKMLLIQHITPSATTNRSPAELMMGRKLWSTLDRMHPIYNPEKPPGSSSKLRKYNIGDLVYAKNLSGEPLWVPATITQITGPLSYQLETSDGKNWK